MNKLLAFAAIAEAATGVALFVVPALVVRLLFGTDLTGVAIVVGRVAGISLMALGWACWPGKEPTRALCAMATYSLLVALYFLGLGIRGEWVGPLLWPAVLLHGVMTFLLGVSALIKRPVQPDQGRSPGADACRQGQDGAGSARAAEAARCDKSGCAAGTSI